MVCATSSLPVPGLPDDQHRRRRRRRLLDHLVDSAHLLAVPDDAAEAALFAQLAAKRFVLALLRAELGEMLEQQPQLLRVHRLGEIVLRAVLQRLDGGLDRALRRQHDDLELIGFVLERLEQLHAVHLRHHHVGDEDGRAERRDKLQRFFAVGRRFRDKAPGADQLSEPISCRPIVFDDEHAFRLRNRFCCSRHFVYTDVTGGTSAASDDSRHGIFNLDYECTIGSVLPENPEQPAIQAPPASLTRGRALAEVVLCSGYPTQFAIAAVLFGVFRMGPGRDGNPTAGYIVALLTIDTALLLGLIGLFLKRSNDRMRDLFLGFRPRAGEIRLGLLSVPPILAVIVGVQLLLRTIAPSLHNVPSSPFAGLMDSPWSLAGFVVLLVLAGGLREELQRAFLLHRFEQHLGGAQVGLVVTSLAFGLGHTLQGWDAAVGTTILGAMWGALYLSRRSVVATVTSHAVFNMLQAVMGYWVMGTKN